MNTKDRYWTRLEGTMGAATALLFWVATVSAQNLDIQIPVPDEVSPIPARDASSPSHMEPAAKKPRENLLRRNQRPKPAPRPADEAPRWTPNPDESGTQHREHTVTLPQGQMTQSWDRSVTEDGYSTRREQTWSGPDGTPIREHESTITGTDPLNFEREKTITLKDGRTIEHSTSQSWDGTTLERERTFTGPNGQTRTSEQTWTRNPQTGDLERLPPLSAPRAGVTDGPPPPSAATPPISTSHPDKSTERGGILGKWNPFGKQPAQSEESGPSPRRPSGFTLGSSGRGIPPGNANGLAKRQPGEPDSAPAARRSRLEQRLRSAARHRSDSRSEGKH